MNFANYQDFRVAVQTMIDGDQLSSTFSPNTLDTIIELGEARVHRGDAMTPGLRASSMIKPLFAAVTANAATIPPDLLALKEVWFSGRPPLEVVPIDELRRLGAQSPAGGQCIVAAQDGDTLTFWPPGDGNVEGRYYATPDPLDNPLALPPTFQRYPEIYLYAALYEAALFLGMDEKQPLWEKRYREYAEGAQHAERMRVYGGSPLRTRAR